MPRREHTLRSNAQLELPTIQLIPLLEDPVSVKAIPSYLTKIWDYAFQSRRVKQETVDRFAEIVSEVFIAGSDLSQQIGQPAGATLYGEAKHDLMLWLAEYQLIDRVRIKLGSGEPMQRQGGYYANVSGEPAFRKTAESKQLIMKHLNAAPRKSSEYTHNAINGSLHKRRSSHLAEPRSRNSFGTCRSEKWRTSCPVCGNHSGDIGTISFVRPNRLWKVVCSKKNGAHRRSSA